MNKLVQASQMIRNFFKANPVADIDNMRYVAYAVQTLEEGIAELQPAEEMQEPDAEGAEAEK